MQNLKRLYKVFQMIRLLNTPPAKSAKQLEVRLNTSKSSVYRMLEFIEEIGYPVDKDANNRYFLQFSFTKGQENKLESEELFFLQDILQTQRGTSPFAESILHKFNLNLSLIPLAYSLPHLHTSRIIQLIRSAINIGVCVELKGYHSLSSNNITNRLVVPLELTDDFRYLIAWDFAKNDQRQFKLKRIESIGIKKDMPVSKDRVASPMDIFGLTGTEWLQVNLKLSSMAYHLLVEEYPLSIDRIKKDNEGNIFFQGEVRNWKGVGRFMLGLPGEVEVVAPEAFKEYLNEKVRHWKN